MIVIKKGSSGSGLTLQLKEGSTDPSIKGVRLPANRDLVIEGNCIKDADLVVWNDESCKDEFELAKKLLDQNKEVKQIVVGQNGKKPIYKQLYGGSWVFEYDADNKKIKDFFTKNKLPIPGESE